MLVSVGGDHRHRTLVGPLLVAAGSVLWGADILWRMLLSQTIPAAALSLYVHLIMLIPLLPWLIAAGPALRRAPGRILLLLVFSGAVSSGLGEMLFTMAVRLGNASVATATTALQPVFATVLARLLLRERLSPGFPFLAGIAVLAGLVTLAEQSPLQLLQLEWTRSYRAGLLGLLCTFIWGAGTVAARDIMLHMPLLTVAALRTAFGALTMLIATLLQHRTTASALGLSAFSARTVLLLLCYALLSALAPLLLYYRGLRWTRATTAGFLESLGVPTALLITWGYFGQALALHQRIAVCVLIVAVMILQRRQALLES